MPERVGEKRIRFGYNPNFMAYNIDEIDGIGTVYAQKLQAHQIHTTTDCLKRVHLKKEDSKLLKQQVF